MHRYQYTQETNSMQVKAQLTEKAGPFCTENKRSNIKKLGPYSQHFIFFVTYELKQYSRMLHYTRLERPARDEH
jgi:hypothetical protein